MKFHYNYKYLVKILIVARPRFWDVDINKNSQIQTPLSRISNSWGILVQG
jgi:hypothetical protein